MKSIEEQILVAIMDGDMDEARRLLNDLTPAERQQLARAAKVMATVAKS